MNVNFDLLQTKPYNAPPTKLPDGDYLVQIIDEETVNDSLVLGLSILDGTYRGQKIRDWLNINHPNETARSIAQSRLRSICDALGATSIRDTRELFYRPFIVTVSTRSFKGRDGSIREANQIDDYRKASQAADPSQAPAPSGYPQQAQPAPQQAEPFWT